MKPQALLPAPNPAFLRTCQHVAPPGFGVKTLPREQYEFVEQQALDVFTAMVNAGKPFQQALTAVYLTGISDAMGATK